MITLMLVFAFITLGVLGLLMRPLVRRARFEAERAAYDLAVYREQLHEVDRDLARGLIGAEEAQAARLEIQRRILAADLPAAGPVVAETGGGIFVALVIGVVVIGGAATVYNHLGNPGMPDLPFSGRPPMVAATGGATTGAAANVDTPEHRDMAGDAEKLEQKLRDTPANVSGWLLLARTRSMLGDWPKAADAYQHAIALGQTGADAYAGLGEMLVMASGGIVSPSARDAFLTASQAEAKNDVARFYLALADSQAGEAKRAIAAWQALAGDIPASSAMRDEIARRVAEAAKSAGITAPALPPGQPDDAAPGASGPTEEQMQAAAQMPPAERDKMIGDMIAKLAARLQDKPDDVAGWLSLGRAYAVQGDNAKALDAYDHADRLRPNDTDIKLQAVASLLSGLNATDPLPARAVEMLRQVAVLMPQAPEVLWYLGVVAARSGDAPTARQNWSKLLPLLTKDGEDYKMVEAALAALKTP